MTNSENKMVVTRLKMSAHRNTFSVNVQFWLIWQWWHHVGWWPHLITIWSNSWSTHSSKCILQPCSHQSVRLLALSLEVNSTPNTGLNKECPCLSLWPFLVPSYSLGMAWLIKNPYYSQFSCSSLNLAYHRPSTFCMSPTVTFFRYFSRPLLLASPTLWQG